MFTFKFITVDLTVVSWPKIRLFSNLWNVVNPPMQSSSVDSAETVIKRSRIFQEPLQYYNCKSLDTGVTINKIQIQKKLVNKALSPVMGVFIKVMNYVKVAAVCGLWSCLRFKTYFPFPIKLKK